MYGHGWREDRDGVWRHGGSYMEAGMWRRQRPEVMKNVTKAKIEIPAADWQKIQYCWTNWAKGEIGGLGVLTGFEVAQRQLIVKVERVRLPRQADQGGLTYLRPESVLQFLEDEFPKWHEEGREKPPSVFWWHSHVNFSTGYSGQDLEAIDNLCAMGGMVATIIVNKDEEISARVDFNTQEGVPVALEADVTVKYPPMISPEEVMVLKQEFDANVVEDVKDMRKEIAQIEEGAKRGDRVGDAFRAVQARVHAERKKHPREAAWVRDADDEVWKWKQCELCEKYTYLRDPKTGLAICAICRDKYKEGGKEDGK